MLLANLFFILSFIKDIDQTSNFETQEQNKKPSLENKNQILDFSESNSESKVSYYHISDASNKILLCNKQANTPEDVEASFDLELPTVERLQSAGYDNLTQFEQLSCDLFFKENNKKRTDSLLKRENYNSSMEDKIDFLRVFVDRRFAESKFDNLIEGGQFKDTNSCFNTSSKPLCKGYVNKEKTKIW